MRTRKSFLYFLATMFIAAITLPADTIVSVTLIAAGPVNDGADYVLPYVLSVNGVAMDADCYDYQDHVEVGQSWQAYEFTLSEAAAQGQYKGETNALIDYEDVAWLSSQATPTTQDQIDLQHVIWNVFYPGTFVPTPGMTVYTNLLDVAQPGFTTTEFADYSFLEAVPTLGANLAQAFVIQTSTIGGGGQNPGPAPESGSRILLSVGLGLIVMSRAVAHMRGIRHN